MLSIVYMGGKACYKERESLDKFPTVKPEFASLSQEADIYYAISIKK